MKLRPALLWASALCVGACVMWRALDITAGADPRRAEDAVAVYLPARALYLGRDPTDRVGLDALYRQERVEGVETGVLSTLYPPTLAVGLMRQTAGGWGPFLAIWRGFVMLGLITGCAAAGWAAARGRWSPLGAALGAAMAVWHPLTRHALELGQANLLIAGLLGAAVCAATFDAGLGVALFAVAGVAVKLVPGVALWPLLAGRRWRALAAAASIGLAVMLVTVGFIPVDRVFGNLVDTVRFQGGVVPAWVSPEDNRWSTLLGVFRLWPLGLLTLTITGVCASAGRRRPAALAAAIALLTAWLGTASAAVGVFYGLILLPAAILVALWPLEQGAPRFSWVFVAVAALPSLLMRSPDDALSAALEMVCVGLLVWAATLTRLLYAVRPCLSRRAGLTLLLSFGVALGYTAWVGLSPPPAPQRAPTPTPQQGPHVGPPAPGGPAVGF